MLQCEELKRELHEKQAALEDLKDALGLERLREEVEMLENKAAEPGFWDNMEAAQKVLQKTAALKQKDETYMKLCARTEDALALVEMGDEAEDLSLLPEAQAEIEAITNEIETMRLTTLLTGEYDSKNAILTFHAGSGGTEAQDWAEMLFRMYNRWACRLYTARCVEETVSTPCFRISSPQRAGVSERVAKAVSSQMFGLPTTYRSTSASISMPPMCAPMIRSDGKRSAISASIFGVQCTTSGEYGSRPV